MVKAVLIPHYDSKQITKEQYKQILRAAVPKVSLYPKPVGNRIYLPIVSLFVLFDQIISHSKSVNVAKITTFAEAYTQKVLASGLTQAAADKHNISGSSLDQPYSPQSDV